MKNKIFVFAFFLICFVPLAAMLVPYMPERTANEVLHPMPSIYGANGGLNVNFLNEFSDYFNDNFGLRNQMISAEHRIVASVFGESSEEKVILGKDGWLFYNETLDDYEGTNTMTPREVYSVSRTLRLMNEYCADQGMDFVFTIAPNKNSLYGDKMLDYYPERDCASNAEMLEESLKSTDVSYVNLFDAFNKESKVLYRRTDSHWTYEGAGLASDCILASINKSFVPVYGGETEVNKADTGDLYKMLYLTEDDNDTETVYARDFSFEYSKPIRSVEDNFIRTTCENKDGSLFMFRDSFGNTLHMFMANEFSQATFCRLMPYNLTLPKEENADTVVVEIVERNIDWLLSKPPIFPAPERDIKESDCKNITNRVSVSYNISEEIDGYYKVEGFVSGGLNNINDNIYLLAGETVYEATPSGEDSFVSYISSDETVEHIAVLTDNR